MQNSELKRINSIKHQQIHDIISDGSENKVEVCENGEKEGARDHTVTNDLITDEFYEDEDLLHLQGSLYNKKISER